MPKNAPGQGTIWQNEQRNRWEGKLVLPSGKRKSVYGKTRREVSQKLAHLRREVEAGMHGSTSGEQSFLAFAQSWYDLHRASLEPGSLQRYRSILRTHFDGIGDLPLNRLTPAIMQQHYARKLATRSSSTVHHMHAFFHAVLKNAVKIGILPKNPCDSVDVPPQKSKEFAPLSDVQTQTLIAGVRGHEDEALIVLAVSTGMRIGELLALTWEDIDWDRHLVRVEHNLKLVDGTFERRRTKSRAGRRKLPLPAYAEAKLRERHAIQEEHRDFMGAAWGEAFGLIFTTAAGYPMHQWTALSRFRRVLAKLGLPEATRLHDLRHTFATLLLERGVHIKVVSDLLGHSSVNITLGVYGHVTPRMQGTAVTEINALLPAPGVAEAVATELEAAQQPEGSVWRNLHTALDQAILILRTERAIAADEWTEFEAAQVALGELTDLIQGPEWDDEEEEEETEEETAED